jgi:hypothetical protein
MFHMAVGRAVWLDPVGTFLAKLDLPFEILPSSPDPEDASAFAAKVADIHNAKTLTAAYDRFLYSPPPRAFAYSADGYHSTINGPDAAQKALAHCNSLSKVVTS